MTVSDNLKMGDDPMGDSVSHLMVGRMIEATRYYAQQNAKEDEREELVSRLLASGMPIDEISLRLKIRADEIRIIESNNASIKLPEYKRTYTARVKSRERTAKRLSQQEMLFANGEEKRA